VRHKNPRLRLSNILKGSAVLKNVNGPLSVLGGSDGAAQMSHFVKDDDLNLFRLREYSGYTKTLCADSMSKL
jgi:hypothetical protein